MTTAALPSSAHAGSTRLDSPGRRYGRMWARVPRELGYLALTALIGLVVYNIARSVVGIGGGALVVLGVVLLALVLLALVLLGSRYVGVLELRRLRWARMRPIAEPDWPNAVRGKTPLRALGDVLGNGHYWLYGLHSAVVNPALATATFTAWFGWAFSGLLLTTSAAWAPALRVTDDGPLWRTGGAAQNLPDVVTVLLGRQDPTAVGWVLAGMTALGLLMLAVLPFITRGATLAHWGAARLLLRRFASDDLRGEVARADTARLAAVTAEDTALRRLERDIHDGPQQRLLRMQMELATAERRLQGTPSAADEPIATARRLAAETLDELRALAQGFAPPLLQDRGLSAALGALGHRGAVPVETAIAITGEVPDAVERSVYFVAAELTTNAIKHSGASRVRLEASTVDDGTGRVLRLVVRDDGRGGAHLEPGHGLAGAVERLTGLGGTLAIESPDGGPTVVEALVPLP